jgi:hypothetical protein
MFYNCRAKYLHIDLEDVWEHFTPSSGHVAQRSETFSFSKKESGRRDRIIFLQQTFIN